MPEVTVHERKLRDARDAGVDALMSASVYVPVTKDDDADLPGGVCRELWVGTAGTATLVQPDCTERADVPLLQGRNPFMVKRVKEGGTADDIWALY
jgi:hypothetical protein